MALVISMKACNIIVHYSPCSLDLLSSKIDTKKFVKDYFFPRNMSSQNNTKTTAACKELKTASPTGLIKGNPVKLLRRNQKVPHRSSFQLQKGQERRRKMLYHPHILTPTLTPRGGQCNVVDRVGLETSV